MSGGGFNNQGGAECKYTHELSVRICNAIASTTDSMAKMCEDNNFPCTLTIRRWRYSMPEFAERYNAAKIEQLELKLQEHKDIIERVLAEHTYVDAQGNKRIDAAAVALAKLELDDNKWFGARLLPKKYGEKIETTVKIDKLEDWLDMIKYIDCSNDNLKTIEHQEE